MKIGIHVHTMLEKSNRTVNGVPIADCFEMMGHLQLQGIEGAVLMSMSDQSDDLMSNQELISICERYPAFYHWMCSVDVLRYNNPAEQLREWKRKGAIGVGELMQSLSFADEAMQRLFAAAQEEKMPVLFHISPKLHEFYGIYDEPGLPGLENALGKYPDLVFIGHSQPFWHEISAEADSELEQRNGYATGPVVRGGRLPDLMRNYPNLWCDLSAGSGSNALLRDTQFAIEFLEVFQDRILYGTDTVNATMVFPLAKWLDKLEEEKQISKEVYEKVCFRNFQRLFGL